MKPERPLVAERMAAMHCDALLARARPRQKADLLPAMARIAGLFAAGLESALAPLCGTGLAIRARKAEEIDPAALPKRIASLAANSLYALGTDEAPALLISSEATAIFRLVDRSFGGPGAVPTKLPAAFPPSAELIAARLDQVMADALSDCLGLDAGSGLCLIQRESSIARLPPLAENARIALCPIEVAGGRDKAWTITLVLPITVLAGLAGTNGRPRTTPANSAEPARAPFCDIPLTLSAVIVDMRVPLAALSALAPGTILPVALARKVPLRSGQTIIAHGTVGEADDHAAIQITSIPPRKDMP